MLDKMIEKAERARGGIELTPDGIAFSDFAGVQRYAQMLIEADLVPEVKAEASRPNPAKATLARVTQCLLLGRRVGIPPEEACQSIYIINNRATIFGAVPLALCRKNPDWVEAGFQQYFEVDGQRIKGNPTPEDFSKPSTRAVCETLRNGASSPLVTTFSVADVTASGLLAKNGTIWKNYMPRMMQARARGHNLNDNFGDSLKGLTPKEILDYEEPETGKPTPTLPTGSLDLRTLNISPPIPPVPPVVPPTTAKPSKKPADLPKPPASKPDTDPLTAAIEELNLFHANAYSDFLGKRGAVPEDVEDSKGEARAEWIEDLSREIRRLSTAE